MIDWQEIDDAVYREEKQMRQKSSNFIITSLNDIPGFTAIPITDNNKLYDYVATHDWLLPKGSFRAPLAIASLIQIGREIDNVTIQVIRNDGLVRLTTVIHPNVWSFCKL